MAEKVTMYPTKVSQPNRNKSSGLQGKCFKAVRRNGTSYTVNCKDQKDPKYHHEWSNAEEILKGNTIQCGRKSTKMCSHATYYGIAGYRNTCPIAGVTGTYTQPATLRVFFDLSKKGISSSAKIEKVEISFDHRCTGVDVSNGKESTGWGPNFDGAKIYPSRKPLTVKIGSESKSSGSNPPLSSKFSGTGNFTFKNVKYSDLVSNGVDIIYGNNLETNPGNIYLKNLKAIIHYTDGTPYINGTQSSNTLYISDVNSCKTTITFTIEAGYKQGSKKVPVKDAPKNLRNSISYTCPSGVSITSTNDSKDERKKIYTLHDNSNTPGTKTVVFSINGTKQKISFTYEAKTRNKPNIRIPSQIERNVKNSSITSIVAENGCAEKIYAYKEGLDSPVFHTFENLDISNQNNIIPPNEVQNFYEELASLPCGTYKFLFKRDNEPNDSVIEQYIDIIPTQHSFKILDENEQEITKMSTIQDKTKNESITLVYNETKELINTPNFEIKNPTHGKIESGIPTKKIIDDIIWGDTQNGADISLEDNKSITVPVGTYYPGNYKIEISEVQCPVENPFSFDVEVIANHRQYFDEVFVRGEDSTAFDYDYLVVFEGDSITEPLRVNTVSLGASFDDIKICSEENIISGIGEIKSFDFKITNTSEEIIQNLMLELNPLVLDEDGLITATTQEWLKDDGIFHNFSENFDNFNRDYNGLISIKNLTPDDDTTDEESVYIHILQINPGEEITIKIPFGSSVEKYVMLQILLFEEPMLLYKKNNCSDDSQRFDKINLRVYDSIATDMNIIGETDLFDTEIIDGCPQECFTTQLEYSITNIDTSNAEEDVETIIYNDPRLVPYSYEYQGNQYNIGTEEIGSPRVSIPPKIGFVEKQYNISGAKINTYIKFDEHPETSLSQYTDYNGETLFYINIPPTVKDSYSIEDLLKIMSIEYEGNMSYNGKKKTGENYSGEVRIFPSSKPNNTEIKVITNQIKYKAGQVVPIRVKLVGITQYLRNEIKFYPKIIEPGDKDSLIINYKICNLENNEGKISTKFITEDYRLIPNEITKNIYCGMDTDIELYTKIIKTIVENRSMNRLYLSLNNKKRDNKDIRVLIREINPIERYDIIDYELDKGSLTIEDRNLLWTIDYIEEDTVIHGYIDLKAKEVGCSIIGVDIKDFIDNLDPKPVFGKDSYKCECRR